MRFPNAAKGVNKIFLAEILMLFAALALAAVSTFAPTTGTVLADGTNVSSIPTAFIILSVCASVLAIVAFIINIVGLNNAKPDDANFKYALLCALLGVVLSVVSAFVQNNATLTRHLSSVTTAVELTTTYFVLTGIMSLASRLKDGATEKKAHTSRNWLWGTYLASLLLGEIVGLLAKNGQGTPIVILGLVYMVAEVATYIIYLRALAAGKGMLNRN